MKLLRCHVEQFGCLKDYDLQPEAGVTSVLQPNGFGKSTLAAFLRCMFYGMKNGGRSVENNLRKRYAPWQGGPFGGWIEFEEDGRQYRLVRRFGLKSAQGDSLQLLRLPALTPCGDYPEEIGQALFGLDEKAFARTVYMSRQLQTPSFESAGLQSRLTDLIENTEDAGSYERAMKLLEEKKKTLQTSRNTGRIPETMDRIARLDRELAEALQAREKLQRLSERESRGQQVIQQAQTELDSLNRRMTAAAAREAAEERNRSRQRLQAALAQQQRLLEGLRESYPGGLPEESTLQLAEHAADQAAIYGREDAGDAVLQEAGETVRSLTQTFRNGVPTGEQLQEKQQQYEDYRLAAAALQENGLSRQEAQRLQELETLLSGDGQEPDSAESTVSPKRGKGLLRLLPAAAALLLVCGLVLLVLHKTPAGALSCAAAAAVLLVWGYLSLSSRIAEAQSAGHTNRSALFQEYRVLRDRKLALQQKADAARARRTALETALQRFLEEYYPETEPARFGELLERLREERRSLLEARKRMASCRELMQQRQEKLSQAQETLEHFFGSYGAELPRTAASLREIREDCRVCSAAESELQRIRDELLQLPEEQTPMTEAEPGEQLEGLQQQAQQLRACLKEAVQQQTPLQTEILQLRRQADRVPELTDQIGRLKAQCAEDRAGLQLLERTIELLVQARGQLSQTYQQKIEQAFSAYLRRIAPALAAEQVQVDRELHITLLRSGVPRDAACFSAGACDLILLCMRFALADALAAGTRPFLILDDPFVNLDDEHTALALQVLQELGSDHQILYLTCSSSRC